MAIFHLSVKTVSRSAGRSATAAAAYRAGVEITDERTGEIHDYQRKAGVESAELFLPAGAPEWATDRAKLWNAAEQSEKRKNSTVAREFEVALPSELSADQRRELAHDFARELVKRHGFAVDVAIHAPGKDGDSKNHHAHILCTTRKLTAEGFTEKTRELDDRATGAAEVTHWREQWAGLTNAALERAGHAERVDHRSLDAQGIDREPGVHLGPTATAIERRGEVSEKTQNHQARQVEAALKVNTKKEIQNDRIRDEAFAVIDGNVRTAGRAIGFSHADHAGTEKASRATDGAIEVSTGHLRAASGHIQGAAGVADRNGENFGRAIKGAQRRVAERHYGQVVEAARVQFERVGWVVRQAAERIEHVVRTVATAAHQVAQQVAARLERQRAAARPVEIRSAKEIWAAAPENPLNIARREALASPAPSPATAQLKRFKAEPKPVLPPMPKLSDQEAKAKLLEMSIGMRAQWDAALVATRAQYLKELTAQAREKAVADVARHQAHLDAKPMLFGREKWEDQRQGFENRDAANSLAWQNLKDGKYPFLERDREAVQKAVERRVSDANPDLAQSMPNVEKVLQIERERVAAEKHAQWLDERQREREAREAREAQEVREWREAGNEKVQDNDNDFGL